MSLDPFARQRLLAEVGDAGQRRLGQGTAQVPEGPAAAFAVDYLERAGVGRVEVVHDASFGATFRHAPFFRYRASGDVALGTWQALQCIRDLLADDGSSPRT